MADDNTPEITDAAEGEYRAPRLIQYGALNSTTKFLSGNFGCDGSYPSYTSS